MAIKKINTDLELESKLIDVSASAGTSGQVLSSTATGISWIDGSAIPGAGGTVTGTGGINYVTKWSNTTGNLVNSLIYDNGTNVGIGTTSPGYKLDVNGTGRFENLLRVSEPIFSYTNAGTKHYTHLATGSLYGAGNAAMIVTTNIPGHNQAGNGNMFSFKLVGYGYAGLGMIDMTIGVYAGENNYYSASWTGTCQTNWIGDIYVYTDTNGKVAFQIGLVTDNLVCEIAATDFVQGFGSVDTSYSVGWTITAVTTLPTQSQKTSIPYKTILPDVYEDAIFHDSVGIGTTSPDVKLEVVEASPTNGIVADFVNSTNAGDTTAAIKLSNADADVCDVIIGANRVNAAFGSDFFISPSDGIDGTNQERLRITEDGVVKFNAYNSTNNTGTPTYLLGTDSSGNVVKTLGAGIPGGPYLPLSGGTLDSGSYNPLALDRSTTNVNMSFKHSGVLQGYLGVGATGGLTYGTNANSAANTPLIQDLSGYLPVANPTYTGTLTGPDLVTTSSAGATINGLYVNKGFTHIENATPQYWLLCYNTGSNDINGEIRGDRTSGHWQAAHLDIIVSSNSTVMKSGTLTSHQVLENNEQYSLVTLTYNSVSYVAIKYTGNTYPFTTGGYFSGMVKSTIGSDFLLAISTGITNEAVFTNASTKFTISSEKVGIGTTAPTTTLDVNGVITATGGNSTQWNTVVADGPYLPLSAGSSYKLTDTLYIQGTNSTGAESVLLRGVSTNDGDWLGSIRTANVGGYDQEMRFYTSDANGIINENLVLTLGADQNATFAGTIDSGAITSTGTGSFAEMLTIDITDISTGENRGLQLLNSNATDQQWNITAGTTGVDNDNFTVRDATNNRNALIINTAGNSTFAGTINSGSLISTGNGTFNGGNLYLNSTAPVINVYSSNAASGLRITVTGLDADSDDMFRVQDAGTTKFTIKKGGNVAIVGKGTSAATITSDGSTTLTTKSYVDGLITGATIYRGTWDPSGGGCGVPNLCTITPKESGYYWICSADGTAEPNGTGCEPDTWNTGDWVIWNDDVIDCAGTGTGAWQKIDNTSVLSGVGTGTKIAKWAGLSSVTDSETLTNSIISDSGTALSIAGDVTVDTSTPKLTLISDGGASTYNTSFESNYSAANQWNIKQNGRYNVGAKRLNSVDSTYLASYNNLNFITGSTTAADANVRMTVLQNGNVGIGNVTPDSKLTVGTDVITTLKPTVAIGDLTNGASLVLRGLSPVLCFDKTGANALPTILTDSGGLAIKNGTLDAHGTTEFIIGTQGYVGIGPATPTALLHVNNGDHGINSTYATAVIEATDSQLDIISSNGGTWGSAINFIEGAGATNIDIWSIARQTTGGNGNSSLHFNFGAANAHNNPVKFNITTTGNVIATGSVKMGDDSATATLANVGTQRYRESGNNSYVDMCMRIATGSTSASFAWVNIVQNNW